eukprot:7253240-Pyramimonas_sp.AAC.1
MDALVAADENMANYERYVLVGTRALNDPTRTRRIGHCQNSLRISVETEKFVGVAEYVGRSLAKNTSSQFVCISCRLSLWSASLRC